MLLCVGVVTCALLTCLWLAATNHVQICMWSGPEKNCSSCVHATHYGSHRLSAVNVLWYLKLVFFTHTFIEQLSINGFTAESHDFSSAAHRFCNTCKPVQEETPTCHDIMTGIEVQIQIQIEIVQTYNFSA